MLVRQLGDGGGNVPGFVEVQQGRSFDHLVGESQPPLASRSQLFDLSTVDPKCAVLYKNRKNIGLD